MIRFFFVFCLFVLCTKSYAQQDGDAAYSFGVIGYSRMALPKMLNQTDGRRYINTNFSSYLVKFDNNLFSYRLSGRYLDQSTQFSNNCAECQLANGKVKDYSFKAGFEKNFNYGPVQPYFAFDLGYRSDEFNGISAPVAPQDLNVSARKRGFTVSPVLGLKFSPVKAISIFAESNLEFFYAWGKETSFPQNDPDNNSSHRFRKGEYLYNPVSVGLQVHLGKQK